MTHPAPYCGDPAMVLGLLAGGDPSGGVLSLFAGRRVSHSFNTRVAIRKAVDILGLKPGDEVLAPAYNCGSELDPLRHAGLAIRLYPVSRSAEIDPDRLLRMVGARTRAIYLTHYFGFLQPETATVRALCDSHGLHLIEDCALSLLSGDAPAEGRAGDISVFCFYKFFPVLAGGAMIVNNDRLAAGEAFARPAPAKGVGKRLLRAGLGKALGPAGAARLLGRVRAGTAETASPDAPMLARPDMPGHYYFDPSLIDARISNFTLRALSGLAVPGTIAARRQNYLRLLEALSGVAGLEPLRPDLPATAVPLSLPARVTGGQRNALVASLKAEGIAATPWWSGYNRHLDFSDSAEADLSAARNLKDSVLSLPIHQYLGTVEIDHIAARVRDLARQHVRA